MWLTGFDVPCMHTMYLDKPMRGHTLMQAIARVNRVFRDKPGGLVVDYLGLADQLRQAMSIYSQAGGKGKTMIDQAEAVALMIEKYEVCDRMFHGFDRTSWISSKPSERLRLIPLAADHIMKLEDGKQRLLKEVTALSKAFALAVPHPEAIKIRDDVAFFQTIRAAISKGDSEGPTAGTGPVDLALQQLVSEALATNGVVDLFDALGLKKPDISILDEAFLREVSKIPQKNLALELLKRLMNDEIRAVGRRNLVQSKQFSQMLQEAITKYEKKALTTVQVIEALISIAKDIKKANARGEDLGLTDDELAFYDALETNDSAVKVLGDAVLTTIARELTETIKKNATIDWSLKESARANMRVMTKRILRKYGYPPDKQEKATATVLEQAALLCSELVGTS
jgi:type I restriction enzyme R subunit